jgi:hypothetical protein
MTNTQNGQLVTGLETPIAAVQTTVDSIALNRTKIFQKSLSVAANSGAQTVATMTSSCLIESIVLKMVTFHANMTTIVITGGAGNVVDFIDVTEGTAAILGAADKQVGWFGAVELSNAKTIVATFAGAGAGVVAVLITIKYYPCTTTGSMA